MGHPNTTMRFPRVLQIHVNGAPQKSQGPDTLRVLKSQNHLKITFIRETPTKPIFNLDLSPPPSLNEDFQIVQGIRIHNFDESGISQNGS